MDKKTLKINLIYEKTTYYSLMKLFFTSIAYNKSVKKKRKNN